VKVSALLREVARRFSRAKLHYGHGTRNAREEAAWLISSVLGFLLEQEMGDGQVGKVRRMAAERIRTRKPLAYLLREAWLGEHAFYVDERVIVPRSFIAELLRERLSPWLEKQPKRALDLCTGSGCLAILAALAFPGVRVDASDLSVPALQVARINIRKYGLGKRVRPVRSDLFESLQGRTYDLIVSNPPYVTSKSMGRLPEEYLREPGMALASGIDGLDHARTIIRQAKRHLNPRGVLVCEIGGNRRALERAFPDLEFAWPEVSDPGTVFILTREQLPDAPRTPPAPRSRATPSVPRARGAAPAHRSRGRRRAPRPAARASRGARSGR
jgi:ribosomal protein L3 glutamine methyltransferase